MNGDICWYCDGTGDRDLLSGAPCHECNGTGWRDEPEDPRESMSLQELIEYEELMDEVYREAERSDDNGLHRN